MLVFLVSNLTYEQSNSIAFLLLKVNKLFVNSAAPLPDERMFDISAKFCYNPP